MGVLESISILMMVVGALMIPIGFVLVVIGKTRVHKIRKASSEQAAWVQAERDRRVAAWYAEHQTEHIPPMPVDPYPPEIHYVVNEEYSSAL